MDWFELFVIGLATWRLAAMVSYEAGPFDVFARARHIVGINHELGRPASWPHTVWAELLVCPWCNSVWLAPAVWALYEYRPEPVFVLAVSAVAVAVERWCNG